MVSDTKTFAIAGALAVMIACTRPTESARVPTDPSPTAVTPIDPLPVAGTRVADQPWDVLIGKGWNYLRRTSSKDAAIVVDPTAPLSPPNVLQIIFTPDMRRDTEPGVNWTQLASTTGELSIKWAMKLSRNWSTSPAGGGKIAFLLAPDGEGQVYINIGGSTPPHRINVNTEWAPYGQRVWEPNITSTPVNYDQWYQIEWYARWATGPSADDGLVRWSVNGVVNGEHRNVRFPACCFQQFEFAPTRQLPPRGEEYLYIDHTSITARDLRL
jgi:hypothetical protein